MAVSQVNTNPSDPATYIFGPFELRPRTGVLLRKGKRVRLQELPLQMLMVLLENHGQLVSRQSLQARLWGETTFVEVDNGLHVVAAKLREALGDRPTTPAYIKTISGRGYCFIGEVTVIQEAVARVPGETAIELVPLPIPAEVSAQTKSRRITPFAITGLIAVIVITASVASFKYVTRPLASEQDRVVVGSFSNKTGNSILDGALSSAVQLKLQESPYLGTVPHQRLQSLLKNPESATLEEELRACASLNGQILIRGQIQSSGNGYEIRLMAWNCSSATLLTTQKVASRSDAEILPTLDIATEKMRRRLGESEASLQKFNVPLMQATTSSLTALKAFTLGEEKRSQGLQSEAIGSYKLAVDLDPQFALAYARLGNVYTNSGQSSLSRENYRKAFELRNRTTDRERLYIITHYYAYTTGEIERAIADYKLWLTLYPRDLIPTNNLASSYLEMGTEPTASLELAKRAVQLDPSNKLSYAMLGQAQLKAGDYAGAKSLCTDPKQANNDFLGFHEVCFQVSFSQNDEPGMQRQLQWARRNPEEGELLNDAALIAIYRGRMREAQQLFSQATQAAQRNNFVEMATDIEVRKAVFEADFGYPAEAREDALHALPAASGNATEQAFAALALARAGENTQAAAEARSSAALAPLDTILNSAILASYRAAINLQKRDPAGAVQALEEVRPFEHCDSMRLAPTYYRGLAYLQNHEPELAAREFRKVIEYRAFADYPLYVVLSQLYLGRSYQLQGDNRKAADAYKEVDRIWSNAEPQFPELVELRRYEGENNRSRYR